MKLTVSSTNHAAYMRRTLELACAALDAGNHPFAAILVKDGVVVSEMGDQSTVINDPTHHPELAVIRAFCTTHQITNLAGCALYTNVEPCPMCAGAIYYSGITLVAFSLSRKRFYEFRNRARGEKVRAYVDSTTLINDGCHQTTVVPDILADEGGRLFENYAFPSRFELRTRRTISELQSNGDGHEH
ncbi:MAG TPA: nucleoside deaminase [Candidatus Acidoferrum sp.]|nr:nucleoside deaminase [Candidatus Acidoferrum sp.]